MRWGPKALEQAGGPEAQAGPLDPRGWRGQVFGQCPPVFLLLRPPKFITKLVTKLVLFNVNKQVKHEEQGFLLLRVIRGYENF